MRNRKQGALQGRWLRIPQTIAQTITRTITRTITLMASVGLAVITTAGCRHAEDRHTAQLEQMHEACVTAMIKSTCQVVVGSAPADAASTVVIAGVGRIDAEAYRSLRASGDAMCGIARTSCQKAWDGPSCTSARALWSVALAEP